MFIQRFAFACILAASAVLTHMTVSLSAYAEDARSLESVMSDMGQSFGRIARPIQQGTAGAAEARVAGQLRSLVVEASGILPPSVLSLPVSQQRPRADLYHSLMNKLLDAVTELEAGLIAGDIQRAKAALQLVGQIRGQGHAEFKI